jgi:hypothetical protein
MEKITTISFQTKLTLKMLRKFVLDFSTHYSFKMEQSLGLDLIRFGPMKINHQVWTIRDK